MLPADDRSREMTVARPETDAALPHVAVVGNVYTILVSGRQSGGRYALIDMYVPPGGGPPPHRHDFEEMFHVLEGVVESHVPRRHVDRPGRRNRQHPRQRAARVRERLDDPGPAPVHRIARRRGGVLPGNRRPRANADRPPAGAGRGGEKGTGRKGQGAFRQVQERDQHRVSGRRGCAVPPA